MLCIYKEFLNLLEQRLDCGLLNVSYIREQLLHLLRDGQNILSRTLFHKLERLLMMGGASNRLTDQKTVQPHLSLLNQH